MKPERTSRKVSHKMGSPKMRRNILSQSQQTPWSLWFRQPPEQVPPAEKWKEAPTSSLWWEIYSHWRTRSSKNGAKQEIRAYSLHDMSSPRTWNLRKMITSPNHNNHHDPAIQATVVTRELGSSSPEMKGSSSSKLAKKNIFALENKIVKEWRWAKDNNIITA